MKIITGHTGTEHVYAVDAASLNLAAYSTGDYVLQRGNQMAYEIISNNQINIKDGDVMIQGHHARTPEGQIDECTIDNGAQGKIRHDIIAVRLTKNDATTGIDSASVIVVKGTPGSAGTDPALTAGNLMTGDKVHEMALYRVVINGLNIASVTPLFRLYPIGRRLRSGYSLPQSDLQEGDVFLLREG